MPNMTRVPEPETYAERADYVVNKLKSLGVSVAPSSRLMQMKKVLEAGYIDYHDARFPIAIESMRDMYQLQLIVEQMASHQENEKFLESAQKLLKDNSVPHNSGAHTPGRDTQFELYLAAVCLRAGMLVDYEEPDVNFVADGTKFAIAAKRLKNIDRFEDRTKYAIRQVQETGRPGIVALDLSLAWNPTNRPITSVLQSQLLPMISDTRNRQLFGRFQDKIERWVNGTHVRAVLAFEFTLRVNKDNSGWIHDGWTFWFPTTAGHDNAETELKVIQRSFLSGIPNLNNLSK